MRIIGGQWRGRRLRAPGGRDVRPTTDRTKEALFNILGPVMAGTVVLDLCCGAGGLGLEALSRGAARVVFVDLARASLQATRHNLMTCGADPGTWQVVQADAVAWLQGWRGAGETPWVLLCDPPYDSTAAAAVVRWLEGSAVPPRLAGAVVEYGSDTPEIALDGKRWRERRYGESHLAVYEPGAAAPEQE